MSANRESLTITSSDVTRRELLAIAAVTGGALVGGQVMPEDIPPAAQEAGRRRRRSKSRCVSTESSTGWRSILAPRCWMPCASTYILQGRRKAAV